jgi:hypothetical protein
MNKGLPESLKINFSNITNKEVPEIILPNTLDPN